MKTRAQLILEFRDAATAKAVAEAVSPDDEGFIRTTRTARTIEAKASADGPLSLLHTLDDYLACVSVAERTAEAARPPARGPRRPAGRRASPGGSTRPARRRTSRRRGTR